MEVLIALAITSFALVLASLVYLQLQKGTVPFFKMKAIELAELQMKKALLEGADSDDSFASEEFVVKRVVKAAVLPDCRTVRIIVFDGAHKKLHELETLTCNGR